VSLYKVRVGYGVGLVVAPRSVLERITDAPVDERARSLAIVLGVRELLQALLLDRRPTRRRRLLGAAIDLAHAVSMVALAGIVPGRRRLALHNAVPAALLAAAGAGGARRCSRDASGRPGTSGSSGLSG
jgi:hypothetical protein